MNPRFKNEFWIESRSKRFCTSNTALKIDQLQNQTKTKNCPDDTLYCKPSREDTIPILLLNKDHRPFQAFGNLGDILYDEHGCFQTSFFRIEKVDSYGNCATLSLLRPLDEYGYVTDSICDTFCLEVTDFCIDVDLHSFCALQCADPSLVNRPMPIEPKF